MRFYQILLKWSNQQQVQLSSDYLARSEVQGALKLRAGYCKTLVRIHAVDRDGFV